MPVSLSGFGLESGFLGPARFGLSGRSNIIVSIVDGLGLGRPVLGLPGATLEPLLPTLPEPKLGPEEIGGRPGATEPLPKPELGSTPTPN